MTPSQYQLDIYAHQDSGGGNARVIARAGSGKTSTCVAAASRLHPDEQRASVFVAFNKHIADELRKKLPRGMDAFTVHSLALKAIKPRFNPSSSTDWIDGNKYRKLARAYWQSRGVNPWKNQEVVPMTEDLLRFTMLTLADHESDDALRDLARHFGIFPTEATLENYMDAVRTLLKWGMDGTPDGSYRGAQETISYDDMVYYANVLDVPAPRYVTIYVDEAQDLNNAQREFVLRMLGDNGRAIIVGDPNQSVYAFAGADAKAFERIAERAQTQDFSLPVCYRCPQSHIRLAQELVPDIEAWDRSGEGVLEDIDVKDIYTDGPSFIGAQAGTQVRENDLVLCRTTAPLIDTAFTLMSAGIPAMVRGRDVGNSLVAIISAVSGMDGYSWPDFLRCLADYRQRTVSALSRIEDNEMAVESFCDRASSVECIYKRSLAENVRDAEALKRFVGTIFDDRRGAVMLSTIHKAKGLEAERVFILKPDLMPHPKAKRGWEIDQENNLRYVAITRSKRELYLVNGGV